MEPYVTPLVRAKASEFGVDLASIKGTGVGGRITVDDVYTAAGPEARQARESRRAADSATGQRPASRPYAASGTPKLVQVTQSAFARGSAVAPVRIDAFATNPLIDDLKQYRPEWYDAAVKFDPRVPTMFESGGDVPLFTAGGFDPYMLLRLPWAVRHLAAMTDNPKRIAEIFERCGSGTEDAVRNAAALNLDSKAAGFDAYFRRIWQWLDAHYARQQTVTGPTVVHE